MTVRWLLAIVILTAIASTAGIAFAQETPAPDGTVIDGADILAYIATAIILCISSVVTWFVVKLMKLAGIRTDEAQANKIRIGITNSLTALYARHGQAIRDRASITVRNPLAADVLADLKKHFPDAVKHFGFEKPEDIQRMVESALPRVTPDPVPSTPAPVQP